MLKVKVEIRNKGEMEESVSCLISVTVWYGRIICVLRISFSSESIPSDLIWSRMRNDFNMVINIY